MAKKRQAKAPPGPHIIWRTQKSGPPRAYGDFRGIPGGGREALVPPGARSATTDPTEAQKLFADRLQVLERMPVGTVATGRMTLGPAMAAFLQYLSRTSNASQRWLDDSATMLGRAVTYYGEGTEVRTIGKLEVLEFIGALKSMPHARGTGYSDQSRRHHLNLLLQFCDYAEERCWMPRSPRRQIRKGERPKKPRSSTLWLQSEEAAALLEGARVYPRSTAEPRMALAYPIIAALLLTGGRADEVLGLEVRDIDFRRRLVHFRANPHRRGMKGKTAGATRDVPLWPQLEEILRDYLDNTWAPEFLTRNPELTLLFPSPTTLRRITDIRDLVDKVAARVGLPTDLIRSRATRITYCAARLQTLDGGEPVAPATVKSEMGHESFAMIESVYGKVPKGRNRAPVVEFRVPECQAESQYPHPLAPAHTRSLGETQ